MGYLHWDAALVFISGENNIGLSFALYISHSFDKKSETEVQTETPYQAGSSWTLTAGATDTST